MFSRYLWTILFLNIVFGVSVNLSLHNKHVPCSPVGFCKCEFPSGMGVDLTLLRGQDFNVSVSSQDENKIEHLLFYPCKNFSVTNSTLNGLNVTVNECESGISLCLQQRIGNDTKLFSFGTLAESHFDWTNIAADPIIIFQHIDRTTSIELKCSESKTPSLEVGSHSNGIFHLLLSSENSCLTTVTNEGHSVFSTFFLILLVLFLFYFICGFLVLRYIRGARGWESIPNGEFWKSSWTSVKKMWVYFMNGCRQPDVYDTI